MIVTYLTNRMSWFHKSWHKGFILGLVLKHLLVLYGVLGGKNVASNLWVGLKKPGQGFPWLELSTWVGLGSSAGY